MCVCIYVCLCEKEHIHGGQRTAFACRSLRRPERHVGSLGNGPIGGCEPPCECWAEKQGSLKEYEVLLTTEPSL